MKTIECGGEGRHLNCNTYAGKQHTSGALNETID